VRKHLWRKSLFGFTKGIPFMSYLFERKVVHQNDIIKNNIPPKLMGVVILSDFGVEEIKATTITTSDLNWSESNWVLCVWARAREIKAALWLLAAIRLLYVVGCRL
jgi:hypothetical protein